MFAEDKPEGKVRHTSVEKNYPYLQEVFPSSMILPLQDALTCVLPASGSSLKGHQAFPDTPVTIIGECSGYALADIRSQGRCRDNAFSAAAEETCLQGIRWQALSIPVQAT